MTPLFRLAGASRRDVTVQLWLDSQMNELDAIARRWFTLIRECGDDVRELMHDGCATACVDDAAFAYVGVFKKHVSVGFYNGAGLPDPAGLLQGSGKHMRHVKITPGAGVDHAALERLILAACDDVRARLQLSE